MNLSTFIYLVLVLCIPYFWYIRHSTSPKKGFSILFVGIISTILLIKFNLIVLTAIVLLFSVLFHKNKFLSDSSFMLSFLLLIYEAVNMLGENLVINIVPILLVSGIFSLMMIGHWFLVDPTITRDGMKNIAKSSMFVSSLLCLLLLAGFLSPDMTDLYKSV